MQYKKEIIFQAKDNSFAKAAQLQNGLPKGCLYRRIECPQKKWARQANCI
jgi:hypothetical protein